MQNETPKAEGDKVQFPALITATIAAVLVIVMMWLFIPGRVAMVRAEMRDRATPGITAPSASAVREQLEGRESMPPQTLSPATSGGPDQ